MKKVPVYILAGGKSSRFKSDKARVPYKNKPLITHMADTIAPFASSIIAVADRADKYQNLGLTTIADLLPGLGPIGGLYTALSHCCQDWLLLTSCDLLGINPDWIKTLLSQPETNHDAIAYREKFWQPLPALYHKSTLPIVKQQIDANQLALQNLLNTLHTLAINLPTDWSTVSQINTPEDLKAYNAKTGASNTSL